MMPCTFLEEKENVMEMKEVMIKFWTFDVDDEEARMYTPPIAIRYAIDFEESGIEGFKEIARDQFEKILNKWEKSRNKSTDELFNERIEERRKENKTFE